MKTILLLIIAMLFLEKISEAQCDSASFNFKPHSVEISNPCYDLITSEYNRLKEIEKVGKELRQNIDSTNKYQDSTTYFYKQNMSDAKKEIEYQANENVKLSRLNRTLKNWAFGTTTSTLFAVLIIFVIL